jgi:uncharacterized protein YndB with AHSA1/START domain
MTNTTSGGATIAPVHVHEIYIKAPAQAIWDAITNSDWTERYGYGGRVDYDLRPGGAYQAHASADMAQYGAPDVIITGEVLVSEPPHKLVQTWHPVWDPDAAREAHTRLTFEITPDQPGGTSKLTVTHEVAGAPNAAAMVSGQVEGAGGGWSFVLSDLKTMLETGRSLAEG